MFAPSPGSRKETQTEQTEGRVAKPADASNNSFRRAVRSGVCDCGHSFKHVEWPLVARFQEVFRGWLVLTPAPWGTSDSSMLNERSLDQESAVSFHSPPLCREQTHKYLPRSSRRLPVALGTRALQRPAS